MIRVTRVLNIILPANRAFRAVGIGLAAVALIAVQSGGVLADKYDEARRRHPTLFMVYYQKGVLEYCGLLTREARQGLEWRLDDVLTAKPISEADHRIVRIAGDVAADMQHDNYGLSGQRTWCRTEGLEAFFRFFDLFRGRNWSRPDAGVSK